MINQRVDSTQPNADWCELARDAISALPGNEVFAVTS
jgi:hypothetical protein